MNELERLKRLCPPPAGQTSRRAVDWDSAERNLGTSLPVDYKNLVEEYGPGSFKGFLSLYQPKASLETIDIEVQSPHIMASLEKRRDWSGYRIPYPLSTLQSAAVTGNGEYLFWVTDPNTNPDDWKITVNEASGDRWYTFDGTLTAFITGICADSLNVPMFPDSLAEEPPYFRPSPAQSPTAGPPAVGPTAKGPVRSDDIREWAQRNGYDIAATGRIPGAVLDAYEKAHESS